MLNNLAGLNKTSKDFRFNSYEILAAAVRGDFKKIKIDMPVIKKIK